MTNTWVAYLGDDKGASLAEKIIANDYKLLPTIIYVTNKKEAFKFGGMCPKLKAIICNFNIGVQEGTIPVILQ